MCDLPTECAWAREAASARIDDELGEVESLRLDRHLRACLGCFVHLSDIGGIAVAIRDAALEQPAARMFTPATPRPRRRVGAVAVGAALALAAGATVLGLGRLGGGSQSPVATAIAAGDATSARADVTQQHLLVRLGNGLGAAQGRTEAAHGAPVRPSGTLSAV
jgi:predicted anti-sigma-YlaC factor YlaD